VLNPDVAVLFAFCLSLVAAGSVLGVVIERIRRRRYLERRSYEDGALRLEARTPGPLVGHRSSESWQARDLARIKLGSNRRVTP
jgi:hypothetical protein